MERIMENIAYTFKILASVFSGWQFKAVSSGFFVVATFFFDALQRDALLALLVLIIFDFFSAVFAAYKTDEAIRSSKIFNTALKIVVYFSLVSAGFIAEKAIPIGLIDEILIGFLVVTELISILENASKAGYSTPAGLLNILKDYKSKQ